MKNQQIHYTTSNKIIVFFSILLWATINSTCNNRQEACTYYSGELLRNYNWKLLIKEIDTSSGAILLIEDKVKDSTHFGSYSFYANGSLESYKFFGNRQGGYSYNEERDPSGKIIWQEGSPLVYSEVRDVNKDSVYIKYYFSNIRKKYDKLYGAVNRSEKMKLEFVQDSIYSNMLSASVGYQVRGLDTIKVYLTAKYVNDCSDKWIALSDTIKLSLRNDKHEFW